MPAPGSIVSAPADAVAQRRTRRRERYAARSVLHRESSLKRVRACGRYATGDAVAVRVSGAGDARRGGLGGVQSCGSVWACPVCSEKVNAGRQAELSAGIEAWLAAGGAVLFGTLTMRHNRGDRLADLLDAIGPCWNRVTSGSSAWKADKSAYGVEGYTRVVETKHGEHGWHPHVHFLLFLHHELSPAEVFGLEARMYSRWETALADRGYSVLREVGIDLRPVQAGSTLADYFTKATYATSASGAAYEVTGSHSKRAGKGGRSPFDLLRDVVQLGDADALDLWHEWERASKGRRQLTWSRGLRKVLALGVEATDQDLVDQDVGGETEATIGKDAWREVVGCSPARVCALLEAVENDPSGWQVHNLLTRWGLVPLGGVDSISRRYG